MYNPLGEWFAQPIEKDPWVGFSMKKGAQLEGRNRAVADVSKGRSYRDRGMSLKVETGLGKEQK